MTHVIYSWVGNTESLVKLPHGYSFGVLLSNVSNFFFRKNGHWVRFSTDRLCSYGRTKLSHGFVFCSVSHENDANHCLINSGLSANLRLSNSRFPKLNDLINQIVGVFAFLGLSNARCLGVRHILSMRNPLKVLNSVVRLYSVLVVYMGPILRVWNEGLSQQAMHISLVPMPQSIGKRDHEITNLVQARPNDSPAPFVFVGANFSKLVDFIIRPGSGYLFPVHA